MSYENDQTSWNGDGGDASSGDYRTAPDTNHAGSWTNPCSPVPSVADGNVAYVENAESPGQESVGPRDGAPDVSFYHDITGAQRHRAGYPSQPSPTLLREDQSYNHHGSPGFFTQSNTMDATTTPMRNVGDFSSQSNQYYVNTEPSADTFSSQARVQQASCDYIHPELLFPTSWTSIDDTQQQYANVQEQIPPFEDEAFELNDPGQHSGRYQEPATMQYGSRGSQNGMSIWQSQQADQNTGRPRMPASELPKLYDIRQVEGRFPDPWSAFPIVSRQCQQYTNNRVYRRDDNDAVPASDSSYDHMSSQMSYELNSSTSNTSYPAPEAPNIMTDSQMTIIAQPPISGRSDSRYNFSTSEHSDILMLCLNIADNDDQNDSMSIVDGISSTSSPYLGVPDSSVGASRSASPVPSTLSVTSTSHPDVLPCLKDDCDATFKGEYRRGNRQRHMRLKHSGVVKLYPCEVKKCGKDFKRQDARLKHYRKEHPHLAQNPAQPRRGGHR